MSDKYAEKHGIQIPEHSQTETIWALIQSGANEDTIEKIAALKSGNMLKIEENLKSVPLLKTASDKINEIFNVGTYNSETWVKLAAWMPDENSVDAVLGLSFLNKRSMGKFIELIPTFEQVAHELVRLLISIINRIILLTSASPLSLHLLHQLCLEF